LLAAAAAELVLILEMLKAAAAAVLAAIDVLYLANPLVEVLLLNLLHLLFREIRIPLQ
jgi:hypothetical protein